MNFQFFAIGVLGCTLGVTLPARAQVECNGWGELRGIRIDGELFTISTRLAIAGPGWRDFGQMEHWRTRNPTYTRSADTKAITCTGQIGFRGAPPLAFRQVVKDDGAGGAVITIDATADADMHLDGAYVFIGVPASDFAQGGGELVGAESGNDARVSFATTRPADDRHYFGARARGARFISARHRFDIALDQPRTIVIKDDRSAGENRLSLFFPLHTGDLKAGQSVSSTFKIRASGEIDRTEAIVRIDPSERHNTFAGIGGNFCWGTQSPTVPFYLQNLRVSWARVAMPLPVWQPDENADPATQPADALHAEIRESFRMAVELRRRKIPIIISAWNAPPWALAAATQDRPRQSRRIDPAKWKALARSIGAYLLAFKQAVGAEPELFSFNESNIGINVLLSPEEHRDAIKRLGAYFESLGLHTKLLLGDANEPRAVDYVVAALADADAMKYVGAVSYHSWNGGTTEQLVGWRDHAERAKVPLIIAEAGTDPEAHRYLAVLVEPWYAIDEVASYVRCMNLSRPTSILQWQLTPDYGLVQGGEAPDKPIVTSQRWWQFKQLDQLTPPDAAYLSTSSDHPEITAAALATAGEAISVIHLVNTGASRQIRITGLPAKPGSISVHITDARRRVKALDPILVSNGQTRVTVPSQSFVTLSIPTNVPTGRKGESPLK